VKRILTTLALVAAMILIAFLIGRSLQPSYPSLAELEAERLRMEQARALAPLDVAMGAFWRLLPAIVAILLLFLSSAWAVAGLARFRRRELVRPDGSGLLPVVLESVPSTAPAALAAYHHTRAIEASQSARVPHTYSPSISYSPHSAPRLDYRANSTGVPVHAPDEQPAAQLAAPLPGLTDLATLGFMPSKAAILLGLGPGGERLTVPASALCHVALCGATGGGKSNLLRLLLAQLIAMGGRVVLADPHYAPFDPASGDDWRPIASRLHLAPAIKPAEIAGLLGWAVDELARRLELRHAGQPFGPPLFVAYDELPVIVDSVKEAPDQISKLLREGRKVGIYTVGASQEFLVKTIGGSSAVRDCYRTAFYVGGDLRSASALLDMPQRQIAEGELHTGLAYLRSQATAPAQLARIPYASNEGITALLGPMVGIHETNSQAANHRASMPTVRLEYAKADQAYSAPASAEVARVASLFAQGLDIAQIVAELRNVKSSEGKRYQQARAEVESLLRQALAGGTIGKAA
jgi:energy-coupling factor transporter ATP-binding protein EcfA2